MRKTYLFLLTAALLGLTLPGLSQSMSNTDNVITLTNTCLNAGVTNGTYNLVVTYYNLDLVTTDSTVINGVTVAISGGVMTITAPSGSLPSVATNGWWSLSDAFPGHIKLTSGTVSNIIFWYQNPDGSIGFNCSALPVDYNSFTGSLSGSQVVLNWQTGLEQNSTYIEIYRYSGGTGGYYKIGQVTAAGNSSLPVNYTFTDTHPCASNTYYLKMLNSQGTPPIFSGYLPVGCPGCTCTLPSPVNCNFTINGPDHICNLETPAAYALSSAVPNYSTIVWSVDDPSTVHLNTYPNFDLTKVTLLKKPGDAAITLKATLSGCTNVITKQITVGAPPPALYQQLQCPVVSGYVIVPDATSWTWTLLDQFTSAQWVTVSTDNTYGDGYNSWSGYIGDGDYYIFNVSYTNICGTSDRTWSQSYFCDPNADDVIVSSGLKVYPNPSNGVVTISLQTVTPAGGMARAVTKTTPAPATSTTVVKSKIYQVRVMDVTGIVRKTFRYPQGIGEVSVDLGGLTSGVYILQIYDNKTWTSRQVVLTK